MELLLIDMIPGGQQVPLPLHAAVRLNVESRRVFVHLVIAFLFMSIIIRIEGEPTSTFISTYTSLPKIQLCSGSQGKVILGTTPSPLFLSFQPQAVSEPKLSHPDWKPHWNWGWSVEFGSAPG